jgi:hypothetical protein
MEDTASLLIFLKKAVWSYEPMLNDALWSPKFSLTYTVTVHNGAAGVGAEFCGHDVHTSQPHEVGYSAALQAEPSQLWLFHEKHGGGAGVGASVGAANVVSFVHVRLAPQPSPPQQPVSCELLACVAPVHQANMSSRTRCAVHNS